MGLRPGYKQTEVGVIPEDWEVRTLGEIGAFSKGQGIRKDQSNSGSIPCVRYGELYTLHNEIIREYRSHISPEIAETSRRLRFGDILFAGSGETKAEIGKCAAFLDDVEAFAGGDIVIFSPVNRDSRLLGYLLNSPVVVQQKASRGQGDAVVHISARALASLVISLPPLPEQRAIAAVLSDVDAALAGLGRLIAKKRDLKQAAMQTLLTGQTRLPGFSGAWEVKRLGDHVRFLKNGTHSRAQLSDEGPVKNLHYGDIHGAGSIWLAPATTPMPTLDAELASRLDRLATGDLIFVDASEDLEGVGTSVEITAMNDVEVVAGLHTIAARFDKSVLADGFKGYLQFMPSFRRHLCQLAAGTKVLATNRAHITSVEIMLPTPTEQTAIAAVLSDMDAEITALVAQADKTRLLKQAMMQDLLTGRTRLPIPEVTDA